MKIQELFAKPVERAIEGVIKADDQRNLRNEVEEFVLTGEIAKGLDHFTERYLNETNANGVWISGFFGSGKSHLLKILSLLLDDSPLHDGTHPADLLLPKIEDQILRGDLAKAAKIPSRSILFNIDQKADAIGGDETAPILSVFVKVFNDLRGYHGSRGHIAEFEYGLDKRGQLDGFKTAWQKETGTAWESSRTDVEYLDNETFAKVYSSFSDTAYDEALRLFDRARESYKVSIESFGMQVKEYIDKQGENFRLNFFVDEVGQFIGQNSKLMLNLQTVAETLATICNGRAWVIVTSQGDLDRVLGDLKRETGDDFTRIQARFKTRLNLTSADVREVIQKRLLLKHEAEPEELTSIFDSEKENLTTLYRFGDGSMEFKSWRGSDEFCDFYPFPPYQFDLFQRSIEQLSKHNAFTGRHTSVGERSMLEVFQSVTKSLRTNETGHLATFDRMFDGISATIRGDMQTSILQAGRQLDDPIALRALKALFLLKWVREFKATPRNVAILLIDRPDINIAAHETDVADALAMLAAQSYLQRNGDVFEFLTDAEKDIEVEIKSTEIDDSEVTREMATIIFKDILQQPKIRFDANGQDYPYARKIDGHLDGREADITVHFITQEDANHGNVATLAAQNTGKPELLAILPEDTRFIEEVRLLLKTAKYVQQNQGVTADETKRTILTERGTQNSRRRTALRDSASELLSRSSIYLNGSKIDNIGYGDPRNRFAKAGQELISFAFPNLRMLKGTYDESTLAKDLLESDNLLTDGSHTFSEAEEEILTYVTRNQNQGERTSVEEMVRQFSRRPYGWYPMATLTLIGRIFRQGKIELRTTEPLDAATALDHLKNSRQHGAVRVRLQETFDSGKVQALKRFHHDFFDRANEGTDARSAGQSTLTALAAEAEKLQGLLDQAGRYPFLEQLRPATETLQRLADRDYTYLLSHLAEFEGELLDAKENLLDAVKAFMHGPQRLAYDEAITFFREEEANFAELPDVAVEPLRTLSEATTPFRGNVVPAAKAAVAGLRTSITALLESEREKASAQLDGSETRLRQLPDFQKLPPDSATRVLRSTLDARSALQSARFVTGIRDRLQRYANQDYPAQLTLVAELSRPAPTESNESPKPKVIYTPLRNVLVDSSLSFISSEDELDQWLAALRSAAAKELKEGKRLSL